MSRAIYLENYRIADPENMATAEIARNGPAITYKGSDLKTGAPVAITIIPISSVDPAAHEQFEKQAEAATLLDHVSIARTVAFGRTGDSFVFVSEYPLGETVEAWVKENGPMPADVVLRVALQVTAALSAASFHGITHPAIQPGNLVIVRGKTADGGWPYIKLTHFALAGLKSAPNHPDPDLSASDFASPEQMLQGRVDFRSEIYSLGATMCFLLTGLFYSAYPRSPQTKRFARPLRTLIARTLEDDPEARPNDPVLFAEELRTCLSNIERREELKRKFGIPFSPVAKPPRIPRLLRRRRPTSILAPIGSQTVVPADTALPDVRRRWGLRPGWAIVALLLATGVVAALILPEDVVTSAFHRKKAVKTIGVPVGIPESSPTTAIAQNPPVTAQPAAVKPSPQIGPAVVSSQAPPQLATNASNPAMAEPQSISRSTQESAPVVPQRDSGRADGAVIASNAPDTNNGASHTPTEQPSVSEPEAPSQPEIAQQNTAALNQEPQATPQTVIAKNSTVDAAPPAEAPDENVATRSSQAEAPHEDQTATQGRDDSVAESKPDSDSDMDVTPQPTKPRNKKPATVTHRSTPSRVPRALPADPPYHGPRGTVSARVVGVTPAGNVILRLPNGERAIVSPQDADSYSRPDAARRRPRRVIIERRIYPPEYQQNPPYQPFLQGDD